MSFGKWLTVTISLIVLIGLTIYVGTTGAFFVDQEQSTQDSLGFQWGFIVLNDNFDGTPWDADWDENGQTDWTQSGAFYQSAPYSAMSDPTHLGQLTSDEIDASESVSISIIFDYYPLNFDTGEVLVQGFNGSTYVTLFDLRNHSSYSNGSWRQFSEAITDSQYMIPGFRLRFVSSTMTSGEAVYIDNVSVITDSDPPGQPQNLAATAGDRENFLDWDDNSPSLDPDLEGYNVYRSVGDNTSYGETPINGSIVTDSYYIDTGLVNGTTYYYRVKAVDIAGNPSVFSNQDSAVPYDAPPRAPTGLAATSGDTEIYLDWNDNGDYDLTGYNVYRSTTSGTGYSIINTGLVSNTTSYYNDTGLTNGQTYYYVVTAVDVSGNQSSYSNEASETPSDLAPDAPTGLTAAPGDRLVTLNWDDNTEYDLAGYDVYRSTTSGSGYTKINSGLVSNTTSNYTDLNLTGGTTYYYVVTAVDVNAHSSAYSNEDSATPTDNPPSSPTGLNATPGDRQVVLDWDDNTETDVTGYDVYRSTTDSTGYTKINSGIVSSSAYTDTAVTGGVTYYYVVKAIDALSQASGYSNQATATPYDSPPNFPTGLGTTPGDRQGVIYWSANSEPDIAGYNIYGSTTNGSGYVKLNTSLITSENYTHTGLVGGTTYYYVLKAVDLAAHASAYSAQTSMLPYDSDPAAPTNLDVTPGDGSATLTWTANTEDDLDGYNVYRSTTSGIPYTKVNTSLVENTTYLDSGLTGGVTYYYVVTAVDLVANESVYSTEDSVTPSDLPPNKPTGLVATPHDASVSLDWSDSADGDLAGYNVYRSMTSGSGYTQINGSLLTSSNYTDTTAVNNVIYYYVVTAVDITSSESIPSNEKSARPNITPAAPLGLTVTPGDKEVNLDWNDHPEADVKGYNVYRSTTSGSGYSMVNPSLVSNTTSNYTDTGLTGGVTYYYVVTAVDTIDNESVYSSEDSATPADYAPDAPTNLTAIPGDRQASLNWNDNTEEDLAGYNVYRSLSSTAGYSKLNTSLVLTSDYTNPGLTGNVTYYYIVTAVDLLSSESANSTFASVTPYDSPPTAPLGLIATPGDKSVSLDWNDNGEDDLAGYFVYRSETSGTGYVLVSGGSPISASAYNDTGLVGGTTYYYVIKAVDDAGNASSNSSEDSATATDADPSAPTDLTVDEGLLENTLDWNDNAESDLDGYNVYRSTTSGSGYVKLNTAVLISASTYTDTNLTAGVTYYYVVTAVDAGENESTYSNEVAGTPVGPTVINDSFDGVPWYDNFDDNDVTSWIQDTTHAMTGTYSAFSDKFNTGYLTTDNLYASLTSTITIHFWYYPHSLSTGDVVVYAYDGTAYNSIADLSSYPGTVSDNWSEFSMVLTESQYFIPNFHLRINCTVNGNEEIWVDDYLVITDDLPPLVPTGLVATNGEQEIILDWDDNSELDLDGYYIYRSSISGNYSTALNAELLENSSYTDTGLTNGTTYYYVITAVDIGGNESDYSNEDDGTPQDFVPSAPTGLTATPGAELIILDWDDNDEIDFEGYELYRSTSSGPGSTKSLVNTWGLLYSSNYTDTGLNGGTTYYYNVLAVDNATQKSAYSNEVFTTAIDPPPAAPTGINATAGDRQAFVEWNANSEPDLNGYNLYRSQTSGSGYAKVNTSGLIATENYTDIGLTGNVTYYYVLTAVDLAAGESVYSSETSVTPTDPAPDAPANLSTVAGDKQVTLDWDDNAEDDLDGYNIYRSLNQTENFAKINTGVLATSDYVDTGLTGYVNYYYKVTAVDLAGHEGDSSNTDNATPTDPPPAAPQNLDSDTGDAEVFLWWDTVNEPDLHGYNVYRNTVNNTATSTKVNGSLVMTNSYTDTGLIKDTQYFYFVTAVDDGGYESGHSPVEATPDDWQPSAPEGLVATPHDAHVTLNWNDNAETDIAGYWVYRSTDNSTYGLLNTGNMTLTSDYMDYTVTNNVTYYYYVTAYDLGGNESYASDSDSARPDPTPIAATGLSATQGDRIVTLTWNAVLEDDIDGYNVYRNFTGSKTNYTKVNTELIETTNFTDTELTGGITYYYVVTAVDLIDNESAFSNQDSATPSDLAPLAPSSLSASSGDRQVVIDWSDNSETDLAGYNVYRSVGDNTSFGVSPINGSLVSNSNYTDAELTGGTNYFYKVTAVDAIAQESAFSNTDNATPADNPPAAPTGMFATAGDKQVSLDWNDNTETDLDGYNVYRSIGNNTSYNVTPLNGGTPVTTSNYTDTGLTGGTAYYYKVKAVDDLTQESAFSGEDTATPTDADPAAPTGMTATPHDGSVTIEWNANTEDDIAGYNVYRSTTSGSGYNQLNGSIVTTVNYTDSTALNETTYYYVVTGVDNGSNESVYSNEDSATPNSTPSAPTGLVASPGNAQVNLDWNDNAETDLLGYNVYRSAASSGPYSKINISIVESSTYTDVGLSNGTTYYYVVTAVDTIYNESGYSTEASTTPSGLILMNDNFESANWKMYWDNNGATDWTTGTGRGGTGIAALHQSGDTVLTSDDMDSSEAVSGITVTFWFNIKLTNKGSVNLKLWNGSSYVTWYDMTAYAGTAKNTWLQFTQNITDSQYFISDFRVQFDGTGVTTDFYVDDVFINTY